MTQKIFITCVLLALSTQVLANALPPPSPAGGRMLRLDESHDFIGTIESWFPKEKFNGLTAEAWIYIEETPEDRTYWSIIGQEGRFNLALLGSKPTLGVWGYAIDDKGGPIAAGGPTLPKWKWVHVVALFDASAGKGFNGHGGNWCCPGGHLFISDNPLRIGGIIPQDIKQVRFAGENLKFRGYIDEVRISNVVRYVGPDWKVPEGKFSVDENTISLWHFDEPSWASRFKDESGNGNHLWRRGFMNVEIENKLTTFWGEIKK